MSKPKLYIIHGWTYTVAPWERTIDLLKKQGFAVEILHVPGLTAPSKKVWTIEEYVRWADRNLPDGAVALGHSNGGRILLNLCAEKPDKLSHLILLDAAGVYETSVKRDTARSLSKKLRFLKKIPGLTKIWHKLTGASDYAKAPANMKQTLANMLDSDKSLDIAKVTTPTSILWGANDTITPPHQAEIIHSKIADSTLDLYPNWTHAPYISHPAELAKAIIKVYKHPPEPTSEEPVATSKPAPKNVANISASMALKKANEPEVKSTAKLSATLAFKKAGGPDAEDCTKRSASLAVSSGSAPKTSTSAKTSIFDPKPSSSPAQPSAPVVDYEALKPDIPRATISTSSVPKVSLKERTRRKLHLKPKPSTSKPKSAAPKSRKAKK